MSEPIKKCNERVIHALVDNGTVEIFPDGTIWRKKSFGRACNRRKLGVVNPNGYVYVGARIGGRMISCLAHRLIWQHFNGNINDNLTVNHKNGRKSDNRIENLELATRSEQAVHSFRVLGNQKSCGIHSGKSKLKDRDVRGIIRMRKSGYKTMTIAAMFKINTSTVSKIVSGKRWRHLEAL